MAIYELSGEAIHAVPETSFQEAGILERRRYQERPERHEYRLTEKGLDLYPVMMGLVRWGNRWLDDGRGQPIEHRHKRCGHVMHYSLTLDSKWIPASRSSVVWPQLGTVQRLHTEGVAFKSVFVI